MTEKPDKLNLDFSTSPNVWKFLKELYSKNLHQETVLDIQGLLLLETHIPC